MSSAYVGIEEARKRLGDLVTAAQQGADVVLTRNGKPAARLVAIKEPVMTPINEFNPDHLATGADREMSAALVEAGIEFEARPDGIFHVFGADVSTWVLAIGGEPAEDDPTQTWWAASDCDGNLMADGTDIGPIIAAVGKHVA